MAIACLRLLTLRPEPLLSVPFFRRRIADSTRFDADFPYFAMCHLRSRRVHGAFQRRSAWRAQDARATQS
jgi:hypothetical protein